MIILDEKYAIDADNNSWQLCAKEQYKDKNTGEQKERYAPFRYFMTMASAIESYINIKQKEKISTTEYTSLSKAIGDMKLLQADIRKRIDL